MTDVRRPVFRPLPTGGVIYADDWRILAQATPTTVPAKNADGGVCAYSDKDGDYDSTASGKKLLLHYESAIEYESLYPLFCFGVVNSGVYGICYAKANGGNNSTGALQLRMRCRPITADFDPSTITWNNHTTSLTIGSVLTSSVAIAELDGLAVFGSAQQVNIKNGIPITMTPSVASPGSIYGVLVDTCAAYDGSGYTTFNGQLAMEFNSASFTSPFVIVPQEA